MCNRRVRLVTVPETCVCDCTARQAESDTLELRPLLVPFRRPVAPAEPVPLVSGSPEQPPEEKVRSWLAGQTGSGGGPAAVSSAEKTSTTRSSRKTTELDIR